MTEKKKVERQERIDDDIVIEVFNDSHASVGYKLDHIERTWQKGTAKKIRMGELYELVNTKGGRVLLEENKLLIKDSSMREALSLSPLSDYSLTSEQIKTLLTKGTDEKLEDVLSYCTDAILDKIVQVAINMPIENMKKARMIQSFSGIDILDVIKERDALPVVDEKPARRKRVIKE